MKPGDEFVVHKESFEIYLSSWSLLKVVDWIEFGLRAKVVNEACDVQSLEVIPQARYSQRSTIGLKIESLSPLKDLT